ncbi:wsv494 [White spot syndrome virus]|uniref:Wsv494 n=2 Tax=White spot syndrome virus TaxID=92652 RepID=Q8VAD1_WSSVS|nr:wsv494 [Shrimp white spot syndrome virus]AAL33495.1 wsv494 [Shrimp white spot syndrome virus]AAL88888.1 WSSV020 [Shrimp white spot syndrome virus]
MSCSLRGFFSLMFLVVLSSCTKRFSIFSAVSSSTLSSYSSSSSSSSYSSSSPSSSSSLHGRER